MAGPRKPTAHLELVGAFKKDPQRRRHHEPQCDEDVMHPPVELSENELRVWDFLCECTVPGVLTKLDSSCLAVTCKALAHVWWGENVKVSEMKTAVDLLGKMGMTPADRSKVVVPKQEKANPFSAFKKA